MKKIPLTQDKYALVDNIDYEYLVQWKWGYMRSRCSGSGYAYRKVWIKGGKGKQYDIFMHCLIATRMGLKITNQVDHVDRNKLNNKRNNLRLATNQQQKGNESLRKTNTSGFRGVYWSKKYCKWLAQICFNSKSIFLGYYPNKVAAAKAYNKAAKKYFGEFACPNKL